MVTGRNGAGKTNLLEALYFALHRRARAGPRTSARSCASAPGCAPGARGRGCERRATRSASASSPARRSACGRRRAGGAARRLVVAPAGVRLPARPPGARARHPSLRRSHLDQVIAALWPARAAVAAAYSAALAQRNALIAAIRAGRAGRGSLPAWDSALARHGIALMRDRAELVERLSEASRRTRAPSASRVRPHWSTAPLACRYGRGAGGGARRAPRRRHRARLHGPRPAPRRPALRRDGRELRAYGSRGQVRLGLLALLLAEREALADERGAPPLLLLDDVMSELDATRRARLIDVLRPAARA